MAKTTNVKVEVRFKRSSGYQVAEHGLTVDIELEPGDDRQTVIDETRRDLAKQVDDFCERAIKKLTSATP